MSKDDNSIYSEYFNITKEYKKKYGIKTVLLMQVGSFFEIYGLKNDTNSFVSSVDFRVSRLSSVCDSSSPTISVVSETLSIPSLSPEFSGSVSSSTPPHLQTLRSSTQELYPNHTEIEEVAQICQFNISEKKITYKNQILLMAGFPDYRLDKYLQKITEGGYTVVVFVQEKIDPLKKNNSEDTDVTTSNNKKGTKRVFHSVHSIGTYISYELDSSPQITNNIMCIWMENNKTILQTNPILTCGISVINIFTGKSNIFQYQTPYLKNPATFDELERSVSIYSPSEIILISPFEKKEIEMIIQYSGIKSSVIHKVDINDSKNDKIQNCMKQKYIKTILTMFYKEDVYDSCMEFNTNEIATQSFCYLLDFLKEHNPNLVRKIDLPEFNNSSNRVLLLNHTIKQLNIIDDDSNDGKSCGHLSSVLSFLNKCSCSMGKRLFKKQLLNPTFNEDWLQQEYNMIEIMINIPNNILVSLRKNIGKIRDIEKISRQMVLQKIYPSSIYNLYKSLETITDIITILSNTFPSQTELRRETHRLVGKSTKETKEFMYVNNYLLSDETLSIPSSSSRQVCEFSVSATSATPLRLQTVEVKSQTCLKVDEGVLHLCSQIINYIKNNLIIENCKGVNTNQSFDENIICKGVSTNLDSLIEKNEYNEKVFKWIREQLNILMNENEKTNNIEYIKEHLTEKSGKSLVITKKRGVTLKNILQKIASSNDPYITFPSSTTPLLQNIIKINTKDIKIVSSTSNNDEIICDTINKIIKELLQFKDRINKEISIVYHSFILDLEKNWIDILDVISKYISKLDVLLCKAHISKEYNYCKPSIDKSAKKSYVESKELRHLLIEQINTSEIYVPNDCSIGKGETDGVLLLGINMAGKSSYIKSIGVSIIMAQSGCYVPASQYTFKPYKSIFSRIVSNDNLFKNLSLFAVEMVELRTILKNSDENSLVLLDELSNGSETQSSVSILMTTLLYLSRIQTSYICSTHFHEVLDFKELKEIKNIKIKHLYVYYDRELDGLVYDRHLKDGCGPSSYGLEVCKSLYFPTDFIEKAIEIRNKYYPENKGVLSNNVSSYNARKIKSICELCNKDYGEDVHHLNEQKTADEKGFITHFHKNHLANLINICEDCHKKEHDKNNNENKKLRKIKTTKGIKIIASNNDKGEEKVFAIKN